MSTSISPDPTTGDPDVDPVLASDAEREAVVTRLHDALGEGRLDLAETETRVAAAYAARHRHDLPPLLADLPGAASRADGSRAPTWTSIWVLLVWRLRLLLGPSGGPEADATAPTARQCRTAAVVVGLVVVWLVVCAAAGALVA